MRLDELDNEPVKKVVFTFGRLNPPHYGHMALIQTLQKVAKEQGADWYLFVSSKTGDEKNPLTYEQKVWWIKALFPEVSGHLVEDSSIKTPLVAATWLYKQGYRAATFVAGEDDMESYSQMIKSGNAHGQKNTDAVKMGKGFIFNPLEFAISPRLASATNSRKSVTDGDPETFTRNVLGPKAGDARLASLVQNQLYPTLRKSMGLGESVSESTELNKHTPNVRDLAKKYTTNPATIHHQINRGVKLEFEHTNDIELATEIAMDHLGERLDYYDLLDKLEKMPIKKIGENFSDGKGPGRPGDSQRHGIPKKATMSELEKASHAKGRKGQLARWQLNMRRGKKKANEDGFAVGGGPGGNADGSNLLDRQVAIMPWDVETPVTEVADQPYRFITPVSTAAAQKSMFQTDSGSTIQVFIQVDTGNGVADIGFFDATDKENPTISMTGKGDAFRIFATVGSIVKQFVAKRKPPYISFSGKSSDAGRIKLYDMIAKNIGRYLPEYKLIDSGFVNGDKGYTFKRVAQESVSEEKKPKKPKTIIDGALKTLIAKGRSEDEAIADLKKEIDNKFYELDESQLMELRGALLQYIKQALPTWPEYVVRDWIYNNNKIEFGNGADIKSHLSELLKSVGLTPNSKWTLVPNLKFTMDMFEPWTQGELKNRAGGAVKDVVARDAERHATQATLAQQQGGVRKEPVILIKHPDGYELQEGWHRTIQHFAQFPNGYTGPAWIAESQTSESLRETTDYSRGEELEGIDIMGAPVFITHHAIERLDRKGERSVDVEEIYEIIEKAVRQHGRDIASLHNTDFALKGENGPPREPKNGFGVALAKTEDSTGNPVYVIKTLHPKLLIGKMPGFKVQGLKRRYSMYEEVEETIKPRVYLDMDGVLADFFGEWAKLAGVEHYKDIDNAEEKLQLVRDHPTFWIDLPLLPHARALVKTVIEKYGEYRVCSTPLNGDERSKPGKIAWLNKHFADMPPAEIVLTHNKAEHAQHDGVASILVDDFGSNINKWRAAGGIGIKYDDSAFPQVAKVLTSIAKSGVVK
jgi:5'(3')-deoxyribonucleotidase